MTRRTVEHLRKMRRNGRFEEAVDPLLRQHLTMMASAWDETTTIFVNALSLAQGVLAHASEILYEQGRPDYAGELDELADGLGEYLEATSAAIVEEGIDAHEGYDVEHRFAEIIAMAKDDALRGMYGRDDPKDLADALRHTAIDSGFDIKTMKRLSDEEILESAREAYHKLQHRLPEHLRGLEL